ncbi:hypothetical protein BaRGS_00003621 [Batillaria attramentaria]|uniref:Uncharacterized protein n=1 Tax=Batillaria attramentaria TaxID=370345 RepID=A0ABD0M137_9CAEN|nr:hypothetical protein BaRGS_011564 [Batillaria attramentaria]
MAFSLTFRGILDNNIRHVYSGMPVQMSYRHSTEYPNMDQLRQRRENQQLKDYVLRTSEYQSDYQCLIPRAPAFRLLSRHEVDEIVQRVGRPTASATPRAGATSDNRAMQQKEKSNPKYMGLRKVSREEMDEIVQRLCRPTTMSTIREQRPQHLSAMPEVQA